MTSLRVAAAWAAAALPDDLDVLSRPLTYLEWTVRSADGREHDAAVYFDAGSDLAGMLGHKDSAAEYRPPAQDFVQKWIAMARTDFACYLAHQNKYGPPFDHRRSYTKLWRKYAAAR